MKVFDSHSHYNDQKFNEDREKIIEKCKAFITECETNENIEQLNVEMFIDGNKRVERLKRLMRLRIDKYQKDVDSYKWDFINYYLKFQ